MLAVETSPQFNEIFSELVNNLDITETQYKKAVHSYKAVGAHLAAHDSSLAPYDPEILPQGSFLLGTIIKPVNPKDDLDVDLVCRLEGKNPFWAQYHLKQIVGDRLKEHGTYRKLLDAEGQRCWTLVYSDDSNYHMDILPSLVSEGHQEILKLAFSSNNLQDFKNTAIRITDNQESNYSSETDPVNWPKSNPFGYAAWFQERCTTIYRKSTFLSASVNPLPTFQKEKSPLQRVVQILKRHRDIMFNGDEDKPISIIITTLAAKSYQKESDIVTALNNIVDRMELQIEEKYSLKHGKEIKWISNPVNEEENFADKWPDTPSKQDNFFLWLEKLKDDLSSTFNSKGIHLVQKSLSIAFGEEIVNKSFQNIASGKYDSRENGKLFMSQGTGILGSRTEGSIKVPTHNFHGKN